MNLTSSVVSSSSSVNSPIASRSPGYSKLQVDRLDYQGGLMQTQNQNSNPDAASSSQGWQRDAQLFFSTGKPVAMVTNQNTKDVQENPKFQKIQEIQNLKVELGHIISIYHQTMCLTWREYSRSVKKICDQKPTEDLKDLDVITAIWCMFMCHTSSCSSSWTGLFNEFAIRQKSIFEVCGTIIPDN